MTPHNDASKIGSKKWGNNKENGNGMARLRPSHKIYKLSNIIKNRTHFWKRPKVHGRLKREGERQGSALA